MANPPPSWYPDPQDPSRVRWWDGTSWTPHTVPYPGRAPEPASADEPASEPTPGAEPATTTREELPPTPNPAGAPQTVAAMPTVTPLRDAAATAPGPAATPVREPPAEKPSGEPARADKRRRVLLVVALVAVVGAVAAFLYLRDDDNSGEVVPVTTSATTRVSTGPSTAPTTATTTTSRPVPSTALPTTIPATTIPATTAPATTAPAPSGVKYVDPSGAYQLTIGPTWEDTKNPTLRSWYTGGASATVRDNVNVFVEKLPSDLTLDAYVTVSVNNAAKQLPGFSEVGRTVLDIAGRKVAQVDFRSTQAGVNFRHRSMITLKGRNAVTLTYTTQPERYDTEIVKVQPFISTIEAL